MSLFKQARALTKDEQRVYDIAYKRFEKLAKMDALDWADLAGSGMARALDDYRRLNEKESLVEAKQGLIQLMAALDVLYYRA